MFFKYDDEKKLYQSIKSAKTWSQNTQNGKIM